jgi:hypothetical protein
MGLGVGEINFSRASLLLSVRSSFAEAFHATGVASFRLPLTRATAVALNYVAQTSLALSPAWRERAVADGVSGAASTAAAPQPS